MFPHDWFSDVFMQLYPWSIKAYFIWLWHLRMQSGTLGGRKWRDWFLSRDVQLYPRRFKPQFVWFPFLRTQAEEMQK